MLGPLQYVAMQHERKQEESHNVLLNLLLVQLCSLARTRIECSI